MITPLERQLREIKYRLREITTLRKGMRKTECQQRNGTRVEELCEAWEQRDLARVGRLSRLIAGGRYGPRKRDY
eukprot:3682310-Pyramimonas_sp.AAC.1